MSDFPRYDDAPGPFSLSEIARWVDGRRRGEEDPQIRRMAPLREAGPGEMGLLAARGYLPELDGTRASAILVSEALEAELPDPSIPTLLVADAHQALALILDRFRPLAPADAGVHPTAIVAASASVGEGARVGPFAVVEEDVVLGARVQVGSHVVIGAGVTVGEDSRIFPHAVLYPGTRIGQRVWIHAGARIGVDGFGYVFREGGHRKVKQVGGCILGDDVEIGANTTIDRGSIGDTRIADGVKIDNLVQLGHNTLVGPHTVLAAQTGVAGSTRIGTGVLAGGQVGIAGHLSIGPGARLTARAGITGDVEPGTTVMGFPARPRMEFLRTAAAQRSIPDLLRRVRALERRGGPGPSPEGEEA